MHDYPPFPGFDAEAFDFLRKLKRNNKREWLTPERKLVLENDLMFPMRTLLAEIGRRSFEAGLAYRPDPKKGIFRIYRDARFSKDKSPFKTNIGATIPFADEAKKGVGCYIHLEPGESFFGGGAYFMDGAELKNFRRAIDADPERLRNIIENVEKKFAEVRGEQLKRPPIGYGADHPALDLLRYKQLWTMRPLSDQEMMSPELGRQLFGYAKDLHEFCGWLNEAIRSGGVAE